MRLWSNEQLDNFERATLEDMRADPLAYGRSFFEMMGEPWPDPQTRLTKGRPPSDRWFAEIDSKIDQRRHKGGPKLWAPGERERLLQTPFYPNELGSRRIYEHPNGEDSDPTASRSRSLLLLVRMKPAPRQGFREPCRNPGHLGDRRLHAACVTPAYEGVDRQL